MDLNFVQTGQPGNNPPVLILHGLFGSLSNWRSIAANLGEHHCVITVDLRNHGQSPHAASMSYPEMVEDIIGLLDKLDHKSAIVAGHSLGGKVAMTCALQFPDRVKALCVVDIAPVSYRHDFDVILSAMKSLPLDKITRRADADRYLMSAIVDPLLRQFLLQNLMTWSGGLRWRINLSAIDDKITAIAGFPDFTSDNSVYIKPVLFMRGENSDYVLPEHFPLIKKLFPAARIRTISNSGHWLHAEQPGLFLNCLNEFLDELPN